MSRLKQHVAKSENFNKFQSAYRRHHSTETALLKILNDVYRSTDNKEATCLVALDLSAAFDTLDHSTLLDRLEFNFGISGSTLKWIQTYLTDRLQYVKVDDAKSDKLVCNVGVPQGSVLGPLLFSLYVAPISNVISSFGISFHQYADDTQLYLNIAPQSTIISFDILDSCTQAVQNWFTQNGLCLNPTKSEVMFLGNRQQAIELNQVESISITGSSIKPVKTIKNLGVHLDTNLTFDQHVNSTCKAAQFHIRALRHVRQSLSREMAGRVACAIVGAKLDYCNGILHGISTTNINKLQRVQNTLARVVTGGRRYDHITPVLKELHWLPIKHRIDFKLATIVYKVKQTQEPSYLAELLIGHKSNRNLRSNDRYQLERPITRTVLATRAFSVAAPNIWNCLPNIIKTQDTIKKFKSKLKTHHFKSAFQ